jgi:hypothetical protein
MNIEDTLKQREQQHGSFPAHCLIEVQLNKLIAPHAVKLDHVQMVGLSMILHKLARILNNGHNHVDSWHDIAGYATLVEKWLNDEQVES